MRSKLCFILLLSFSLCACAADKCNKCDTQQPASYSVAVNSGCVKKTKYVPVPVAGQLMPVKCKAPKHLTGEAAIVAANKKSVREPNSGEYINSIMTFDYMPGALYQIYAAPLNVTDIQFQNNEHLVAVGAGDTMRWQVSKTYSGVGAMRQEHLLVKPIEDGLINSIVVTTDQRTYHLLLHSTPKTYMASVAWRYPDSDGVLQNVSETPSFSDSSDITSQVDLSRIDTNYNVELVKGPHPDWYPKMVFNDGNKTYIKLPCHMQQAPTLFIGNNVKTDQLVNYRVVGDYYVVDSLFPEAQLRSGQNDQVVVQISYRNN